jgi:hydroxyacylglutathione hydrolase
VSDIIFDRDFAPDHERPVAVAPGVRRVTARNPGPFTFLGTNSYIVGKGTVAIIDPGPDDPAHGQALLDATEGERISHILVTHTHRDHSSGSGWLQRATGAATAGAGPHRLARPLRRGESSALEASADTAFTPDITLADGDATDIGASRLTAVATPGHAANHLAFALAPAGVLFSGDHVMGWSTTIVAPPDGSMADYMASLDRLLARPERRYLPGHGGAVEDAPRHVAGLKQHRLAREAAILARIAGGDRTVAAIVAALYARTDPALHGAAALSVLAHLEDLSGRGLVVSDGPPGLDATYRPA